jgi:predicted ABC-type transport system involved in lysophospholipase L1 biosynthesis ATPase subunit
MPLAASIRDLSKIYRKPGTNVEVAALRSVSIDFEVGEYTAIMGASGSGKSTMMNIIGCLDRPTHGSYILGEHDVSRLDDDRLSEIRSQEIGFIFQNFNLIQQLPRRPAGRAAQARHGAGRAGRAGAAAGSPPDAVVRRTAAARLHRAGFGE